MVSAHPSDPPMLSVPTFTLTRRNQCLPKNRLKLVLLLTRFPSLCRGSPSLLKHSLSSWPGLPSFLDLSHFLDMAKKSSMSAPSRCKPVPAQVVTEGTLQLSHDPHPSALSSPWQGTRPPDTALYSEGQWHDPNQPILCLPALSCPSFLWKPQ